MKILALETSAKSVSAAVTDGGVVRAYTYQNTGLTHSRTLMPLVDAMLRESEQSLSDMDLLAVAAGPGSFTGLRIGVSTLKGLAWAADKPCCGVSTLEAMAQNLRHMDGLIVCSMDARRSQVYNAVFAAEGGQLTRLTPDRAIALSQLAEELQNDPRPKLVVGDGAQPVLPMPSPQPASPPNWRPPTSASKAPGGWPGGACPGPGRSDLPAGPAGPRLPPPLPGRAGTPGPGEGRPSPTEPMTEKGRHGTMDEMVHVLDHPLLQHKLSILRDETTGVKDFREIVNEVATLMCYEATRDLPLQDVEVQTPVAKAVTKQLAGKKLAIVPVLRAGLGMVEGILTLIPSAKVGHIGLFRDPETLEPVKYYCKMPTDIAERDVIILDPMLATGGSASAAITFVKEYGVKNIKLMNILAAPEGIARVRADHPDVEIYIAAVDEKLNDHGYIVPGLGDAGDRIFGTK